MLIGRSEVTVCLRTIASDQRESSDRREHLRHNVGIGIVELREQHLDDRLDVLEDERVRGADHVACTTLTVGR